MYATTNSTSVPRSQQAPAHSMRSNRLPAGAAGGCGGAEFTLARVVRSARKFFAIDVGYISLDITKQAKIRVALYLIEYDESAEMNFTRLPAVTAKVFLQAAACRRRPDARALRSRAG